MANLSGHLVQFYGDKIFRSQFFCYECCYSCLKTTIDDFVLWLDEKYYLESNYMEFLTLSQEIKILPLIYLISSITFYKCSKVQIYCSD